MSENIKRRKRKVLSLEDKLEIVKKCGNGYTAAKIAKEYGIGVTTVRDIVKSKNKIEHFCQNIETNAVVKKRKTLRCSSYDQLDRVMFRWLQEKRAEGLQITSSLCMQQANMFFEELGLKGPFNASSGWLRRFKERHGIINLQNTEFFVVDIKEEILDTQVNIQEDSKINIQEIIKQENELEICDNSVVTTELCNEFYQLIKGKGFVDEQIYSANVTCLYWRELPTKLIDTSSNDKIMILCCTNITGNHKLPLIFFGKSVIEFPKCENIYYYGETSSLMTAEFFQLWWKNHFLPDVIHYLKEKKLPQRAMLILDCPSHPLAENFIEKDNIFIYMLPSKLSPGIKSTTQRITETLKKLYKKRIITDLITRKIHPYVFWKLLDVKEAIYFTLKAWQETKNSTIANSFKKIYFEQNDIIDETTHINDITAELKKIQGCNAVDTQNIQEWLAVKEDEYNNIFLKDCSIEYTNDFLKNEFNKWKSEKKTSENITNKEALNAANTLLLYLESQNDMSLEDTVNLRHLIKVITTKEFQNGR